WTDKLKFMVILGGLFGAIAGVSGTLISGSAERIPTGPVIVLCMSIIVVFSMLFAVNRGLVWNWLRSRTNRHQIRAQAVLANLHTLAMQHPNEQHGHSSAVLRAMSANPDGVSLALQQLKEQGHAQELSKDAWALTKAGLDEAGKSQEKEA
ncbi:MAG: metal ABC transporter permease, partial [Anaerolineales bacterium]|nr:metal ABC transporter permease [Anaerolineales bacterium]